MIQSDFNPANNAGYFYFLNSLICGYKWQIKIFSRKNTAVTLVCMWIARLAERDLKEQ